MLMLPTQPAASRCAILPVIWTKEVSSKVQTSSSSSVILLRPTTTVSCNTLISLTLDVSLTKQSALKSMRSLQSLQDEAGLPACPLSEAIPDLLTPPGSPQLQPSSPQPQPASKSASPANRRQGPVSLLADAAAEELSEAALMPCLDAKQALEAARGALAAADVADRLSLDWQAQNAVHLLCKWSKLHSLSMCY